MKHKLLFLLMSGIMMLASCSSSDEPDVDRQYPQHKIALTENQMVQKGNTDRFAQTVWNELASIQADGNVMISPLSLYQALAMSANGADDEGLQELLALLAPASTLADVNDFNKYLFSELPKVDPGVKLSLSSSVWVDENRGDILPAFSQTCATYYFSDAFNYKKSSDEARVAINRWASDKTAGLISNLLTKAPENDVMLLAATCFDGKWTNDVDKSATVAGKFYAASGLVTDVDVMDLGAVGVRLHDNYTEFAVSYGNGGYAMTIVLPADGQQVDQCLINAVSDYSENADDRFSAILHLPKFSLRYSSDTFLDLMAKCGLQKIGAGSPMFDKIVDTTLAMQKILHSTTLEVTEAGTKAAAVSDVEMGIIFNPSTPVKLSEYTVDRPFGFFIRETSTGAILFMGRVTQL